MPRFDPFYVETKCTFMKLWFTCKIADLALALDALAPFRGAGIGPVSASGIVAKKFAKQNGVGFGIS